MFLYSLHNYVYTVVVTFGYYDSFLYSSDDKRIKILLSV